MTMMNHHHRLLQIVFFLACAQWTLGSLDSSSSSALLEFEDWLVLHDKSYQSTQELAKRREIFLANAQVVQQHNQAYEAGVTAYAMTLASPFADLTDDEFAVSYLMESQNCSATHQSSGKVSSLIDEKYHGQSVQDLPSSIDWRTRGVITPIKNQKHCGSCWTFSTSGTLEAHTCIHNVQPHGVDCTQWTGLAEQQLLDCASAFDNHGCNGGLPSHAFEYIKFADGMATEDSYKYLANDTGPCLAASPKTSLGAHVAETFNITAFDEDDLVSAIAQVGPVSIAYQVAPDFRLYSHGVYDSWNATTKQRMCKSGPHDVNHAVVAVGYGSTEATGKQASIPYYIVRNSWSTSWGMEGYFWMERNENLCGVSDCASFPVVPTTMNAKKDQLKKQKNNSRAEVN